MERSRLASHVRKVRLSEFFPPAEVDEAAAIVAAAVAKVRAAQTLPPGSRVVRQSS